MTHDEDEDDYLETRSMLTYVWAMEDTRRDRRERSRKCEKPNPRVTPGAVATVLNEGSELSGYQIVMKEFIDSRSN